MKYTVHCVQDRCAAKLEDVSLVHMAASGFSQVAKTSYAFTLSKRPVASKIIPFLPSKLASLRDSYDVKCVSESTFLALSLRYEVLINVRVSWSLSRIMGTPWRIIAVIGRMDLL